jgi:uncharacterized protein GlcG (DUF336 family)
MSDFRISLDKANTIITATFAKGKEAGMKPLSCVVVDAGGHVIAFQRQDGTSFLRLDIARVKGPDGLPIGAVGVTGDTSDNDEIAALAGIAAAGLTPL